MIADFRSLQLHRPVSFHLYCCGEYRAATGTYNTATKQIEYECPVPPFEELPEIYRRFSKRTYPKDGVHRGMVQVPLEHITFLDEETSNNLVDLAAERKAREAEALHDALARVEQEISRIKSEGAIAPNGCWIETGKVKGRSFRQAWWRSATPVFTPKRSKNPEAKVKSCYIGEEGSPEHRAAIAQRDRRNQLKQLHRQLELLLNQLTALDGE